MNLVPATVRSFLSIVRDIVLALRDELAELRLGSDRAGQCATVTLAVVLSVILALAFHVDATWWAAMSAFVSTQATAPASLKRGMLRIVGTALGAALGALLAPWLADDRLAMSLVLLVASTVGVMGLIVSRHGYAWLLGAVTLDMVLLAMIDDPYSALSTACNRTAEVTIGTLSAILVAYLLAPATSPAPAAEPPGWRDFLGRQWPVVEHALHAGISVTLVPFVWIWLDLPNPSQTAITAAAVMAVPVLSGDAATDRRKITERSMHRLLGCLAGGILGLGFLALSIESFLLWLMALALGIWIAAHVQGSSRGIGYVGTQGAVVLISTLIQGAGPADSILPGISRFVGIAGGLLLLWAVSLLLAPAAPAPGKVPQAE